MSAQQHIHSGSVTLKSEAPPDNDDRDERALATAAELKKREHPDYSLDRDLTKAFYGAITDVAKDSRTRSLEAAKYLQIAAGAIGTLYTGALGLAFSTSGTPLPVRGMLTPIFLGLAVVLSAVYLAYISSYSKSVKTAAGGATSLSDAATRRANYLVKWINHGIRRRAWAMRSAVLAMGIGLAFLPAPFVTGGAISAASPTAPTIPDAIPEDIKDEAVAVFKKQADAYTADQVVVEQAEACDKPLFFEILWTCGWRGERGVNARFLSLFLIGLVVVAVPAVQSLLRSTALIQEKSDLLRNGKQRILDLKRELEDKEAQLEDVREELAAVTAQSEPPPVNPPPG